jgi:hypothetical protein
LEYTYKWRLQEPAMLLIMFFIKLHVCTWVEQVMLLMENPMPSSHAVPPVKTFP